MSTLKLHTLISANRELLLERWVSEVFATWHRHAPEPIDRVELTTHCFRILQELETLFMEELEDNWQLDVHSSLSILLREITTLRARQGFKPTETALFAFSLKKCLMPFLKENYSENSEALYDMLIELDRIVDRLALFIIETYTETRERIIAQQSLSLMELSTPVIRVWERILMLPLVGVIDTLRARQITDNLLDAVSKTEALVTIMDVTGVPVLDTSVAGHLMKAIASAQLLGTQVIVTGISPDGAQTLTKLGVDFSAVTTRASLRSGLAEAFMLLGKKVVSSSGLNR